MNATGYKIQTELTARHWKYTIFYEGEIVKQGISVEGGWTFATEDAAFDTAAEIVAQWTGNTEGMEEDRSAAAQPNGGQLDAH